MQCDQEKSHFLLFYFQYSMESDYNSLYIIKFNGPKELSEYQ